ncbi:MAG: hypothetical protein O7D32_10480 [bacterium]|nr:hypothetical protein [bacterium]
MSDEILEAWRVNNRMNFLLLDAIPAKALEARYSPRTRSVASQFAHVHNNRVYHLEKRGPNGIGSLESFPRGAQPGKRELRAALKASEKAIADMFDVSGKTGKIRGWKDAPTTYLGYFIAHEAHHRALALVALRLSGTKLPKDVTYGIWYWRDKKAEK